MKRFIKVPCILFLLLFLLSVPEIFSVQADSGQEQLTILFTHDLHDHFLPFKLDKDGEIREYGGYERLQSAINIERQKDSELLLFDGGDFSMGTLFQSIFASDAPELRAMGQMGYDVLTFGNHEFDYRAQGLADSLNSAKDSEDRVPRIVASNIRFPLDAEGKITGSIMNLKNAMESYGVKEYIVLERKNKRIGVFGLMGKDSASNAPMAGVEFADPVESARSIVKKLKQEEKVDLIICLSHSGIWTNKKKSEDEILAKKIPEIDVIISGHTHSKLEEPILAGNTIICSVGEYGENLGVLNISHNSDGKWNLNSYGLKKIDEGLNKDSSISQSIESFKKLVKEKYLKPMNMDFDDVLAYSSFNFVPASKVGAEHKEEPLGSLISDAYIYAVKKAEGDKYEEVDVAIVPSGTIRGSFVKGNITVSDAFTVSSLGIGADKKTGYPLISVYLTGKELKAACEVDASVAPIMSSAQLYMSGISYTFNPNRLIFNKVTDAAMQGPDGSMDEIDDKKLYRVVAGLYSGQMLSVVGEKSFGLLSIVPKTKDGAPVSDFEAQIIRDAANGNEVKEWEALAEYLKSFDKVDGIPQVPLYYSQPQGRKNVEHDGNIMAILSQPNAIALTVYGIIAGIVVLVIFLAIIITRRRRKLRNRRFHNL